MSHRTTVKTELRDRDKIVLACKTLGFPCVIGPCEQKFYEDGVLSRGDVKVQLPGWQYPVVINTTTGEAFYDNYNGHWGDIERMNDLVQQYAAQVVLDEAQEFTLQGFGVETIKQENGDIQIVIEH